MMMTELLLKEIDEPVLVRLKRMASAKGHSVEQEIADILTQAVNEKQAKREAFSAVAAELRSLAGAQSTDSAQLIREDRDCC
jgi:plasmid stability protein